MVHVTMVHVTMIHVTMVDTAMPHVHVDIDWARWGVSADVTQLLGL